MHLKQEMSEINDFEEEEKICFLRKLLINNFQYFKKILGKTFRRIPFQKYYKIFLHIILFQIILRIFFILRKKIIFSPTRVR